MSDSHINSRNSSNASTSSRLHNRSEHDTCDISNNINTCDTEDTSDAYPTLDTSDTSDTLDTLNTLNIPKITTATSAVSRIGTTRNKPLRIVPVIRRRVITDEDTRSRSDHTSNFSSATGNPLPPRVTPVIVPIGNRTQFTRLPLNLPPVRRNALPILGPSSDSRLPIVVPFAPNRTPATSSRSDRTTRSINQSNKFNYGSRPPLPSDYRIMRNSRSPTPFHNRSFRNHPSSSWPQGSLEGNTRPVGGNILGSSVVETKYSAKERQILDMAKKLALQMKDAREMENKRSPLDKLKLLLEGKNNNAREQIDWNYIVSLFTDIAKKQKEELKMIFPCPRPIVESVRGESDNNNILIDLPNYGPVLTSERAITEVGFRVPANFLNINYIPYLVIGENKVRFSIDELIALEKERMRLTPSKQNDDVIEIYKIIKCFIIT